MRILLCTCLFVNRAFLLSNNTFNGIHKVLSLRSGMEYFARIVACAALLTTSFLGQWLHHLEHDVCGYEYSRSKHSCLPTHTHNHDSEHPDSAPHGVDRETPAHDHDSPAVPHDHHTCSICYVIGQAVSNPVLIAAPTLTEPLFEQVQSESEFAASASCCIPIARGPPASLSGRC